MHDQKPPEDSRRVSPPDHGARLSDPERLAALDRAGVMDTPAEAAFDRVVRLATHIIGVPVGLVSFVDADRQFFKAQSGLPSDVAARRETPLSHSFCQYVVTTDAPLVISDARTDPLVRDNLAVPELGVVAYLGVPIHSPEGKPLGSLCAIDNQPRAWSDSDLEALHDLTAMLETELRLRREREAIRLLAQELNHRVKNLFTLTGGMISMTARSAETPAKMAEALQGRLSALSWAHDLISPAITAAPSDGRSIDLASLISRLLEPHLANEPSRGRIEVPDLTLRGKAVADMALVIHELATNAAKYGSLSRDDGRLDVLGTEDHESLVLDWRESGGPELESEPSSQGFGSRLIATTVESQLGGSLETDWHRAGIRHRLRLPLRLFKRG